MALVSMAVLASVLPTVAFAREDGATAILTPQIERRRISESQIRASNIEVGAFAGVISIEDFGSSPVYGVRLGYHVSEDVFFEAAVGQARAGDTSFETLNPGVELLRGSERDFRYYNFSVGYNLLPGEAFVGGNRAYNTAFYLLGGAGSTRFAGDDNFTVSVGAGYRVILAKWMTVRLETRNHVLDLDVTGRNKTTQNLEWTLGLGGYF
ncbi:MAG: outer membrane beta-barrel domain-containing protein [Alcanivorax sp.]|nr:outer membrane beta-barrel domain-containing protein [Alcanivorax sp.]